MVFYLIVDMIKCIEAHTISLFEFICCHPQPLAIIYIIEIIDENICVIFYVLLTEKIAFWLSLLVCHCKYHFTFFAISYVGSTTALVEIDIATDANDTAAVVVGGQNLHDKCTLVLNYVFK